MKKINRIGVLAPVEVRKFAEYLNASPEELPWVTDCPVMTEVVKCYLEQGYQVVLFTLTSEKVSGIYRGDQLTVCVGRYFPIGKVRAFTQFGIEVERLRRLIQQFPCDVYHANWSYEYALAALAEAPNKTVVTLHDWGERVYEFVHDYYRRQRLKMNNRVLKKAEYVTCVSEYIRSLYLGKYKDRTAAVVPNSYCRTDVSTGEKVLNKKTPVIITVNHGVSRLKNSLRAVDAFALIQKEIPTVRMRMFGVDHEAGGVAQGYATEHGITGIEFCGAVEHDEIIRQFQKADLLLHTSREESFGLVAVEALINRTPVVGGIHTGGIREILQTTKGGLLTDIESKEEIAGAVIRLLTNETLWEQCSRQGYENAVREYRPEDIVERYLEVMRETVNEREGRTVL